MRIYVTHCSAKKNDSLRNKDTAVPPDALYTATPTQRFMSRCKQQGVRWAVFSDLYGVWFPEVAHPWYEKDPDSVTESEFRRLLMDFDRKLREYDEIFFYYNPGRFHRLYKRIIHGSRLASRIRHITHLQDIARVGDDV